MTLLTYPFTDLGSIARASSKVVYNSIGAAVELAQNTLPLDFDPVTFVARGLFPESQRTNSQPNPRLEGAAAGSPGTMPSGTSVSTLPAGITRTIATGTANGLPFIEVAFAGTAGSTLQSVVTMADITSGISPGSIATPSALVQTIGDVSGLTGGVVLLNSTWRQSGGSSTGNNGSGVNIGSNSAWTRVTVASTAAPALTARVDWLARLSFVSGVSYNFAVRFQAPQVEIGATFPSSPILPPAGSPAQATRAADNIALPLASSLWTFNPVAGTIYAEVQIPQAAPAGLTQGILALHNSDNRRLSIRNAGGGSAIEAGVIVGGVETATVAIGTMTPGTAFRVALGYDQTGIATNFNGASEVTNAAVLATDYTNLLLGRTMASQHYLHGYLRDVIYVPRRLSNAQRQTLTNLGTADVRAYLATIA